MNDSSPTFYRAFQDQYSHLDLAFCSNGISDSFDWRVYHDRLSSDHFPIFIDYKIKEIYTTKLPKWKFAEANWRTYHNTVSLPDQIADCNIYYSNIITSILNACSSSIPKTGTKINNKYSCFWWTPECKQALSNAKRQFRILQRFHCPANVVEYRRLDAIATRTLLEARNVSFKNYLSTVNKDTCLIKLWRVINSLSGKRSPVRRITLSINNVEVSEPRILAHEFGLFFSNISSDNNYSEDFLLHKIEEESTPIIFPPSEGESYKNCCATIF